MSEAEVRIALANFGKLHPLREPERRCTDIELEQTECFKFTAAPIAVQCKWSAAPPTEENEQLDSKYLWVMMDVAAPFALEHGIAGSIKHTNLTGGAQAYCGGEVWFANDEAIYLNGGSGRYPCERDEALLSSVKGFYTSLGYSVAIPPFNEDNGQRPRVFKSEAMVEWETHA